ncbi:dUTP diphosphatase [bacterium]|nr:dUTP diphosphatase [bacterium]
MKPLEVEVTRLDGAEDLPLPRYMSDGAAGLDLHAAVGDAVAIPPGGFGVVPTGLALALPVGHEAQVRSRSGLAARNGVFVLNSPGTIDADYRGEVSVILANLGDAAFRVERGDRIAQLVVSRVERVTWVERRELTETVRSDGGFGHTGTRIAEDG